MQLSPRESQRLMTVDPGWVAEIFMLVLLKFSRSLDNLVFLLVLQADGLGAEMWQALCQCVIPEADGVMLSVS